MVKGREVRVENPNLAQRSFRAAIQKFEEALVCVQPMSIIYMCVLGILTAIMIIAKIMQPQTGLQHNGKNCSQKPWFSIIIFGKRNCSIKRSPRCLSYKSKYRESRPIFKKVRERRKGEE